MPLSYQEVFQFLAIASDKSVLFKNQSNFHMLSTISKLLQTRKEKICETKHSKNKFLKVLFPIQMNLGISVPVFLP